MMRSRAACLLLFVAAVLFGPAAWAQSFSGTVYAESGAPAAGTYLALMDAGFGYLADATADAQGAFNISAQPDAGYLVVQPPANASPGKPGFALQPRIYRYAGEDSAALRLPPVASLVIEAYDPDGKRMLWEDFERLGKYGGQFLYATNLDDEAMPMACWPVHSPDLTGMESGPREKGVPAVLVEPGKTVCVSMLFWPTRDYGKLLLRADNAAQGYTLAKAGDSVVLNLNVELAKSAVQALGLRAGSFETGLDRVGALVQRLTALPASGAEAAREADALLADALRLRDDLELERAQREIAAVRYGDLRVKTPGPGYTASVKQVRRDFLFGVYEGSPYNAKAWEAARAAGFDYATVLPAWNWTQRPSSKRGDIDKVFGLSALKQLDYRVKAHGVVWMQGHGILPEHALDAPHERLTVEAIEHQQELLSVLGESIDLWEAINEPANTNVPGVSKAAMKQMMTAAAKNIRRAERPVLVNSPHEFSHGSKYWLYTLYGEPAEPYPVTYSEFLRDCEAEGLLDDVDIIGLQCYPGFHLNADWNHTQGPAYTPAHLLDTLHWYKRFGKNLHITELSFPSSYGKDWFSGYWREPWTPETQADYAAMVYTLAFAEPMVHSVTWWDITDEKPSVITGGLLGIDGKPKPVFERLRDLIAAWDTPTAEAETDEGGEAAFRLLGGEYDLTVRGPDGQEERRRLHVLERWQGEVEMDGTE
ncbi:MAG: hypothetical protein RLZZ303_2741 [Candidatus Hydrogenedentota bacterium]